jgi:hypothetical protein
MTHYNTAHVVFTPQNMTKEELYSGYINIYKEFYSFKNILKRMPESPEQRMPYFLFNLFYRKFGKLISRIIPLGLMNSFGKMARHLSYGID